MSNIKKYKYDWKWNKKNGGNPFNNKIRPANIFEDILVFNCTSYFPKMEDAEEKNIRKISENPQKQKTDLLGTFKNGFQHKSDINKRYPKNELIFSSREKECNSQNRLHPTQKPVSLLEYLIETYTKENETVLDFTMGSGSTGVACANNNRKFIGIELDEKYYEIAKKRIKEAYEKER